MQADVICLGEQFIERDQFDAVGCFFDKRIVGDHGHVHGDGAYGGFLADVADADQAEGLAADLVAGEGFLFPFLCFHGGSCRIE